MGVKERNKRTPRRSPGLLRKARSVSNLPAPLPTQWCFLSLTVPLGAFLCVLDASAHACGLLIASSRVCAISRRSSCSTSFTFIFPSHPGEGHPQPLCGSPKLSADGFGVPVNLKEPSQCRLDTTKNSQFGMATLKR